MTATIFHSHPVRQNVKLRIWSTHVRSIKEMNGTESKTKVQFPVQWMFSLCSSFIESSKKRKDEKIYFIFPTSIIKIFMGICLFLWIHKLRVCLASLRPVEKVSTLTYITQSSFVAVLGQLQHSFNSPPSRVRELSRVRNLTMNLDFWRMAEKKIFFCRWTKKSWGKFPLIVNIYTAKRRHRAEQVGAGVRRRRRFISEHESAAALTCHGSGVVCLTAWGVEWGGGKFNRKWM